MLTAANAKALSAPIEHGALIYASSGEPVVPNSPAQRAGLQRGDIITKVNGQEVNEQMPLATRLSRFKPGDQVELTVRRNNQDAVVKATLDQHR
jgi:S1-C subfamily serine protease